ncbi:MAG: HlyD family secretion protein [Acidobacteriota bacterium]
MDTLIQQLEKAKTTEQGTEEPQSISVKEVRPARKFKRLAIVGGALAILAGVASAGYLHYRDRVSTDDAQVDTHVAPIAPKIFGNIAEIMVDDNQVVKAGQVLLRIDPRDYEAKVAQARAALSAAQNQSAGASAGVPLINATTANGTSTADAQFAAATADFERAKTDYDRASTSELAYVRADVESKRATADRAAADLRRMEPLVAKDEISKLQFDAYIAAARVAESDLNAAQQKLVNAEKVAQSGKSSVDAAEARVAAARSGVEQARANREQVQITSAQAGSASATVLQARANLEAAELQLSYTTIVAPVDGVVTKKNVQLGQIVQPGQSLLTVVPVHDVWVTANFKETQLANVKPGQKAEVYVDMYGRSFEARVDSIAVATGAKLSLLPPENATGNYVKIVQRIPVKITLVNPPDGITLRPGMNVEASILTK